MCDASWRPNSSMMVATMTHAEHEPMDETAYLRRSPENARRLRASIEELEAGRGTPRDLIEDGATPATPAES
jgi:antitoxin YefM